MKLFHFKGFHIVSALFIKIFTLDTAYAITLFPFVIYRNKYAKSHIGTRTHESIHIAQQLECGLAGLVCYVVIGWLTGYWLISLPVLFIFYTLYLASFIINIFRYKDINKAYLEIPFEKEASLNENRPVYIGLRKPFLWLKYCSNSYPL